MRYELIVYISNTVYGIFYFNSGNISPDTGAITVCSTDYQSNVVIGLTVRSRPEEEDREAGGPRRHQHWPFCHVPRLREPTLSTTTCTYTTQHNTHYSHPHGPLALTVKTDK